MGDISIDTINVWESPTNDMYSALACSIRIVGEMQAEMDKAKYTTSKIIEWNNDKKSLLSGHEQKDSMFLILVIGESHNKYHSSIYGNTRRTSPIQECQKRNGSLFVFNDVVTPYNITSKVLKNILYCNSISADEKWSESPYFPAIFKQSGYNVYFWDNQRDMSKAVSTFTLNSLLFDKKISGMSYTQINSGTYSLDAPLIDDFANNHKKYALRNLIIFHLQGQHIAARTRYPHNKRFTRFLGKNIPRKAYMSEEGCQDVADYDNATLYNDYVLGKIIEIYRNSKAVMVYLSDHGEEVYDYRNHLGRAISAIPSKDELKYQFQIPFVIWCSDKFKENNLIIVDDINKSTNRPFMSDNLCHLLFNLGGLVNIPYYHIERDLISKKYHCDRRIVNGNVDYDKRMNRK